TPTRPRSPRSTRSPTTTAPPLVGSDSSPPRSRREPHPHQPRRLLPWVRRWSPRPHAPRDRPRRRALTPPAPALAALATGAFCCPEEPTCPPRATPGPPRSTATRQRPTSASELAPSTPCKPS